VAPAAVMAAQRAPRRAQSTSQRPVNTALARSLHSGARADREKESTMSANPDSRRTRPDSAPAYYLGRPASVWLTVTTRRPGRRTSAVKHPGLQRQAGPRPAAPRRADGRLLRRRHRQGPLTAATRCPDQTLCAIGPSVLILFWYDRGRGWRPGCTGFGLPGRRVVGRLASGGRVHGAEEVSLASILSSRPQRIVMCSV